MVNKVLHVIPSVGSARGGPSTMVRSLARELAHRGIDTHVATTNDNGLETLPVACGVPVAEQGVTYWYFPRQTRHYTFSAPLATWLARHVAEFDVVHIHALFSFATLPAAFWAYRRNVPYVIRPLGTLNEWGMKNRRPWLKRLSFRFVESRIIEHAALIHYTSEQERLEAHSLGMSCATAIIPNALPGSSNTVADSDHRPWCKQLEGRRVILFLSRFDRKKGLDLLLRAFAKVQQEVADVSLLLAGDGPEEFVRSLQEDAVSLEIHRDVVWAGFLADDEKRAAFALADVFSLPSYSENFGIAVVEAMAAGLPVVISDQVGIHSEIDRANAGLVVSCDVDQIAGALIRILKDHNLSRTLGINGSLLAHQHYSPDVITAKVIDVYNDIVLRKATNS